MAKKSKKSSKASSKKTSAKKTSAKKSSAKKTKASKKTKEIIEEEELEIEEIEEEEVEDEEVEEEEPVGKKGKGKKTSKSKASKKASKASKKSSKASKKASKASKKSSKASKKAVVEESLDEEDEEEEEVPQKPAKGKKKTKAKKSIPLGRTTPKTEKEKIRKKQIEKTHEEEKRKIEEEILSFHEMESDSKKSSGKKKRNYSEVDKAILDYIKKHRKRLYEDFLQDLQVSNNELAKSLKRLEGKDKVAIKFEMEDVKYKKYVYYSETPVKNKSSGIEYKDFNSFNNLPCLLCQDLRKCNLEQDTFNPISCDFLNEWIEKGKTDEPYDNPFKYRYEDMKKKADKDDVVEEEEEAKA